MRLHPDNKPVGNFTAMIGNAVMGKNIMRPVFESDDDFRCTNAHPFACAQIKRHACPAPVINQQFQRNIGFSCRFLAQLGRIFAILAKDKIVRINRTHGVQHAQFFIAYLVGIEPGRGFHRNKTKQLQQMVLQHIAYRPVFIIISGAIADTNCFSHCDLHMINIAIVPQRFKNHIGKPQRHQILHGLFAQIMIDTIDLAFPKHQQQLIVNFFCRSLIMAQRFFNDEAALRQSQTSLGNTLAGSAEQRRGNRKIKDDRPACCRSR